MITRRAWVVWCVLLLWPRVLSAGEPSAQPLAVLEQPLMTLLKSDDRYSLRASPDGEHVACMRHERDRVAVVSDGTASQEWDVVEGLTYEPDTAASGYLLAYWGQKDGSLFRVRGGRTEPSRPAEGLPSAEFQWKGRTYGPYRDVENLVPSPDRNLLAAVVREDVRGPNAKPGEGILTLLIVGGESPVPVHSIDAPAVLWLPLVGRLASWYKVAWDNRGGKLAFTAWVAPRIENPFNIAMPLIPPRFFLYDLQTQKLEQLPNADVQSRSDYALSDDGWHVAYRSGDMDKSGLTVDGTPVAADLRDARFPVFAPEPLGLVYWAQEKRGWRVISSQWRSERYEDCGPLAASEDGPTLVFWAKTRGKWHVCTQDSTSAEAYDSVLPVAPRFEDTGRVIAGIAVRGPTVYRVTAVRRASKAG